MDGDVNGGCAGCDDAAMVEYGHGVSEVSGGAGGGGGLGGGGPDDLGAAAVSGISNAVDKIAALPPEMLLLGAILVLVGLVVLKRAF
jgi:hypothetical protein